MRLKRLFQQKPKNILSIYFTAGYPERDSTMEIVKALDRYGADMIEIGIPFSDPMADGPAIQHSNSVALQKGMSLDCLFGQLRDLRKETDIPVLLMGYFNPILQYGFEKFCTDAVSVGIDGYIIPDLLPEEFGSEYREITARHQLQMIFLVTSDTREGRIRYIDGLSDAFIYLVTSSITTGGKGKFPDERKDYFESVRRLELNNPVLAGFGVKEKKDLDFIAQYFPGAIIGSAFVKHLSTSEDDLDKNIQKFFKTLQS